MRESCTSGSVRGARGNSRPYRNRSFAALHESGTGTKPARAHATACPQLAEAVGRDSGKPAEQQLTPAAPARRARHVRHLPQTGSNRPLLQQVTVVSIGHIRNECSTCFTTRTCCNLLWLACSFWASPPRSLLPSTNLPARRQSGQRTTGRRMFRNEPSGQSCRGVFPNEMQPNFGVFES